MGKDSYPVYRRRDYGQVVEVRNSMLITGQSFLLTLLY
jgi:hypothetical protein